MATISSRLTTRAAFALRIVAVLACAVLVAKVWLFWLDLTRPPIASRPASTTASLASAIEPLSGRVLSPAGTLVSGSPDAMVMLVEFSDFQCPYCAQYARDTYGLIQREFVDSGKVRYVYRNFPLELHSRAFQAAESALCAGEQGRFWQMHDLIFALRIGLDRPSLEQRAARLELNRDTFRECLEAGRPEIVRRDQAEGLRLGINSTPVFLIGFAQPDGQIRLTERILGAQTYSTFKHELEKALISLHHD